MATLDSNLDTNKTLKRKGKSVITKISEFRGIYGDRTNQIAGGHLYSELLETRSIEFEWKIDPHSHPGLFQLFFIDEGCVELFESEEKRFLNSPCVILIPPTVLHGFDFGNHAKGRILSISEELLHQIFKDAGFISPMLSRLICLTDFSTPQTLQQIKTNLTCIHEELFDNDTGKEIMLRAYLQELFIIFYRIWKKSTNSYTEQDPVNLGYFEKFQRLIRAVNAKDTVKNFAAQLAITPVHLNRICNTASGKSAGQLMNERLLEESKKYLSYTSYSVAEVAYMLQFDYPNYFARFFKKHTTLTPSEYRRR